MSERLARSAALGEFAGDDLFTETEKTNPALALKCRRIFWQTRRDVAEDKLRLDLPENEQKRYKKIRLEAIQKLAELT